MKRRTIFITEYAYRILSDFLAAKRHILTEFNRSKLTAELKGAKIMQEDSLPGDVIRLGSHIAVKDLDGKKVINAQLVPPSGADIKQNKLSFLAPLSVALIGYRQGDVVDWEMPTGMRKYEVISVRNE